MTLGAKQAAKEFKKQLHNLFGTQDLEKIANEYSELKASPNRSTTIQIAKELAAKEKALEELSAKHNEVSQKLMDYQIKLPIREAIAKFNPRRPEYATIIEHEALPRIKFNEQDGSLIVLNKQGQVTEGKEIMTVEDLISEIASEMPELVNSPKSGHGTGIVKNSIEQKSTSRTIPGAMAVDDIRAHNKLLEEQDRKVREVLANIFTKN